MECSCHATAVSAEGIPQTPGISHWTLTHFFSFWYYNAHMDRESSEKRIVDRAAGNIDRIGGYRIVRRLGAKGLVVIFDRGGG